MRAVVYHGARDVRVEEVAEPEGALGPDEVLIAPRCCGICGTDLHEYVSGPIVIPSEPHPLTGARLPQVLGHELAADVVDVGDAVTGVRAGDRVSILPLVFCGRCDPCRRGLNHLCVRMGCVGLSWRWGGLAPLAVVREHNVAVLPDELSYEQGALIEPAAVAAWSVVRAGVRPRDSVVVTGAGPIGCLAILAALAAGAGEVFAVEPNAARRVLARSLGCREAFDPAVTDVVAEVRERTAGRGSDVCLECAGSAEALRTCLAACRPAGTVSQTGLHTRPAEIDAFGLALREVTLTGTWCYPVQEWPRLMAQVASGRFPVERIVTGEIGIEDTVAAGFDALLDPTGTQVKVLVRPGG
jgi:(R,R)-butanediol dehydrogenase / meso-butanediol dehydrogenase / diacetyl reductase